MSEAREEAKRRWPDGWGNAIGDGTWRDGAINGFVLGAEWHASRPVTDKQVERMCEVMHDAYELAAVDEGWSTQQASRKPWAGVPEANKRTMRVAVRAVLEAAREAES